MLQRPSTNKYLRYYSITKTCKSAEDIRKKLAQLNKTAANFAVFTSNGIFGEYILAVDNGTDRADEGKVVFISEPLS